jgi:branched-chain amino acid transport system ATP-binding protein
LAPDLIHLDGMSVSYGNIVAVSGVNLSLPAGAVLSLLGPNGAGKSSILKGIAGTARTSGTLTFDGQNLAHIPAHRRTRHGIAMVPQGRRVFPDMSVEENLLVGMRGARRHRQARLDAIYTQFPRLIERKGTRAGYLSGGEQQMLTLGRALMSEPRVLLLDEPSLGLAPKLVTLVFEKIREIVATNVAVILVDQNATQAMALADRVCVVHRGKLVYNEEAAQARNELHVVHAHLGVAGLPEKPDSDAP